MDIVSMFIIILIIYIIVNRIFYKKNNTQKGVSLTDTHGNKIKTILRGSSRFSLASLQDKSPLIALLHANYGTGYFWALRDAFTDKEIYDTTGLNIQEYQKKITDIQDSITKNIIKLCPNFASELDLNLAKIAGEY
jgi:uncharacterized protein (UPF0333 family)